MLVVLPFVLELSSFSASFSRFFTSVSSLSSRFSHSRSFFLSSNRFSASFLRFISFCSRSVRYLWHKHTGYNAHDSTKSKNNLFANQHTLILINGFSKHLLCITLRFSKPPKSFRARKVILLSLFYSLSLVFRTN